ncbi:hypothetical protein ACIQ7D_30220 [Streptomyces sp. NPDC096310]|uniref:hypothetical protein n=1 Tax=Streptomyces sp. NPDC096310 TaxID=3366082 RepID=UPI00382E7D8C
MNLTIGTERCAGAGAGRSVLAARGVFDRNDDRRGLTAPLPPVGAAGRIPLARKVHPS